MVKIFGQSWLCGQFAKGIAIIAGCDEDDANDIAKGVQMFVAVATADLTGAVLASAAEGAMIEAGVGL